MTLLISISYEPCGFWCDTTFPPRLYGTLLLQRMDCSNGMVIRCFTQTAPVHPSKLSVLGVPLPYYIYALLILGRMFLKIVFETEQSYL